MGIFDKLRKLFSKNDEPENIYSCNVCGSRELEKIGEHTYCTVCGTILK